MGNCCKKKEKPITKDITINNTLSTKLDLINNNANTLDVKLGLNDKKENNKLTNKPNPQNNNYNKLKVQNIQKNSNYGILKNQGIKNNNNCNVLPNQIISKNKSNNNFPQGTKYEEKLNLDFRYFNIYWYAPNKTDDFRLFQKCFENVEFIHGYELDSALNFFKKELISEWIVIAPGSKGKELIEKLENVECIKTFFIYCRNPEFHKEWAKNRKKIGCITSNPEILCQKLIELNKDYIIPNFNYQCETNDDMLSDLNKKNSEIKLDTKTSKLKPIIIRKNKEKNKYNNYCMKVINYFNQEEALNNFNKIMKGKYSPIYLIKKLVPEEVNESKMLEPNDLKNVLLLSLYFNNSPLLLNTISFQEVKDLFNVDFEEDFSFDEPEKLNNIFNILSKKIKENKCILNEKDDIREIQIISIKIFALIFDMREFNSDVYYQIANFLRDIDFCLKILLISILSSFSLLNKNFIDHIILSLATSDMRFHFLFIYLNNLDNINNFTEQEINLINNSLTIKDFIILGDQQFYEKIKTIENNIDSKSFKYLNMMQISKYIYENKNEKGPIIVPYFYFLIIKFEDFQENYENIILISLESGITFLVFLYIENEYTTKIYKNKINFLIPTILVYSPQDILKYLSQKLTFYNPLEISNIAEFFDLKFSKITFEQNDEDNFQDGCFELAETFDTNLITNKHVFKLLGDVDYVIEFTKNIYNIYKDHNALDLFYQQNCLYLGWKLYPELVSFNVCFVKRFLYMYCREEKERGKSLYRIINEDLKSRDSSKIYPYITILALINQLIEKKWLASYKGDVYRATKLDEKLIMKLVPGIKMVNTTFWSTSKDFTIAERFMIGNDWRNSYIICKNVKNNIDIESEQLDSFNEKEVLFLPFNEFRVDKISTETKYGKKIYNIEVTELGNKYFVNYENMKIENINNLGLNEFFKKFTKNFQKEFGKLNFENLEYNQLESIFNQLITKKN